MKLLQERILAEGRHLGRGILKIDGLLNHQLDVGLMVAVGERLAAEFASQQPTRILTAEVSGIVPAVMTARALGDLPVVYARKHKPVTMTEPVFFETAPSHTKGGETKLMVSPEYLQRDDRVLIIDDFLATGLTIAALARIVRSSGATLVGIGAVVEKSFEGGRTRLADWQVPIFAVVRIRSLDGDVIAFEPE